MRKLSFTAKAYICLILGSLILVGVLMFQSYANRPVILSDEYYGKGEFIEIDSDGFKSLERDKKSFMVFAYQPMCAMSHRVNQVLEDYMDNSQISLVKMQFSDLKQTSLASKIKHAPTVAIIRDGKLVRFLDAASDDDTKYYESAESFKEWVLSGRVKAGALTENSGGADKQGGVDSIGISINSQDDLDKITIDDDKVNIYLFWGDGCSFCSREIEFLGDLKDSHGDKFSLYTFEVWHSESNSQIMQEFASILDKEVSGVPFTVIGDKTFAGFSESMETDFIDAVQNQPEDDFDVYSEYSRSH